MTDKVRDMILDILAKPQPDLGPEIGEPTPEEREAARIRKCPTGCGASLDPMGRHLWGGGWNCHRCGAQLSPSQYEAVVAGREVPREEIVVKPWLTSRSRT